MRKNEAYFLKKGYTQEQINNHYNYKNYKNKQNKFLKDKIKETHKKEIENAKKYFKKINISIKGDGIRATSKSHDIRQFIYFSDINGYIEFLDNNIKF